MGSKPLPPVEDGRDTPVEAIRGKNANKEATYMHTSTAI